MLRRKTPRFSLFARGTARFNGFLLAVLLTAGVAHAQSNPQQLTEANRAAMDAYNNLDIETAKKILEDATKNAEKANVHGQALARTYANLGVVYVGGLSDNAAGLDAFVKALKEDGSIEPDPLVSTPEIQQVFGLAKRKAGGGGGGGAAAQPHPAPGPVEGNMQHVPAAEQLTQTAVPVYVSAGDLPVASMKVFYRSLGMPQPKSTDLKKMTDGWGALIPCTDVFEPNVEYFIVALDDEGAQVGNAGTPQNPVSVPIVTTRNGPAPSLPGEVPPSQCSGAEECPPGMPGCHGNGGLGDTCHQDSDCGEGMMCEDNFCATGERSGGDEDESDDGGGPGKMFIDVSGGVSMVYVGQGAEADSAPPAGIAADACKAASGGDHTKCQNPDTKIAQKYVEDRGWSCTVTPANNGLTLSDCTVAVQTPGFVPVFVLNFAVGYTVNRWSVGVSGRIQPLNMGDGALAGIILAVRGEYSLTQPKADGFHAGLLAGIGVGRLQAQPPAQTKGTSGPYATSGIMNIQLGTRIGYLFNRHFGLIATPVAHFMLPSFLFGIDLVGGAEFRF